MGSDQGLGGRGRVSRSEYCTCSFSHVTDPSAKHAFGESGAGGSPLSPGFCVCPGFWYQRLGLTGNWIEIPTPYRKAKGAFQLPFFIVEMRVNLTR
jgi:hypothetical protein